MERLCSIITFKEEKDIELFLHLLLKFKAPTIKQLSIVNLEVMLQEGI